MIFSDKEENMMREFLKEMSRRSAEKWERDPRRNTDPHFRWTDANRWDKD